MVSCTRLDRSWKWFVDCAQAFQQAKDTLTSLTVCSQFYSTKPIKLAADSSAYGIGTVIVHVLMDDSEWPITFASRTVRRIMYSWRMRLLHSSWDEVIKHVWSTVHTGYRPQAATMSLTKGIPNLTAA